MMHPTTILREDFFYELARRHGGGKTYLSLRQDWLQAIHEGSLPVEAAERLLKGDNWLLAYANSYNLSGQALTAWALSEDGCKVGAVIFSSDPWSEVEGILLGSGALPPPF